MGAKLFRPQFLALLAEAYEKAGQIEEALTTLAEALTVAKQGGECWWDAELYRLKGELLLQTETLREPKSPSGQIQDKTKAEGEVENCFQQAIEIARRQRARSLELRATVSLCRLWHSQGSSGKHVEAYQMLAEIYGWFTEGFDTKDLKEAKALLAVLI